MSDYISGKFQEFLNEINNLKIKIFKNRTILIGIEKVRNSFDIKNC